MAVITDTRENSTIEAARALQEATRRYMGEQEDIGRGFWKSWSATAHAGMHTALDLQDAMFQASRTVMDAAAQANRRWFDQWAEIVRGGQDATMKMMVAGFEMVESAVPKTRP